jgi:uncharacterized membrane protein YhaH (DUF805 family)
MGFGAAIKSCFSKYVTFSGRARRSEFWWFVLFNVVCGIIARILDWIAGTSFHMPTPDGGTASMGYGYIYTVYLLAVILPGLAVTVRRLHDRDRSGWWYWLVLIPLVGAIWLLVWFCLRGTRGDNRFGPDPLSSSRV